MTCPGSQLALTHWICHVLGRTRATGRFGDPRVLRVNQSHREYSNELFPADILLDPRSGVADSV